MLKGAFGILVLCVKKKMEIFVRGIFSSVNPFNCFDVYKQETDLIKSGKELMVQALREFDQAEKTGDLAELTAAKQNAHISLDFANKALIELQ